MFELQTWNHLGQEDTFEANLPLTPINHALIHIKEQS